ncbi:MAG: NRDE family protein, partial [Proteobacteria bacterium]|nr:NRDE family protein [Pseudomonadota bacterium]
GADRYNGFNLLVGEKDDLYWTSNRSDTIMRIPEGLHGISNHLLDTPWPKVTRGKDELARLLDRRKGPPLDKLFGLLKDGALAPDATLPQTGVPLEWERTLSSIFITSPTYGTRSSTLLLIDQEDHVTFVDRTFNGHPDPVAATEFEFFIET